MLGIFFVFSLYWSCVTGLYFTSEPQDRVTALYGSLWWNCQALAEGPVTYNWRHGEADLPSRAGQTIFANGTLFISRVLPEDENHVFTCVATSGGQSIESREATLRLAYIDLAFTQQPVGETVLLGNQSILSCQITSLPPAVINWTLDGQPVTIGTVTMPAPGSSMLSFSEVGYVNAGRYKCQASNPLLHIVRYSEEAELVVIGPPVFVANLASQAVPLGYTAKFDVRFHGNPAPVVSWYQQTSNNNNGTTFVAIQSTGSFSVLSNGSLLVRDVRAEDSGYFLCHLENAYGAVNQSASLISLGEATPPVIVSWSSDVTAVEGSTVTLHCRAEGTPQPTVSWETGDGVVLGGERFYVSDDGNLTITSIQDSDVGFYACLAVNPEGNATQRLYLEVQVAPSFTLPPSDTTVLLGEMVNLSCVAAGNPKPDVSWTTPDTELYTAPTALRDGILVEADGTLTILQAEMKHDGTFTCSASNLVSMVTASVRLTVQAPPMFTRLPVSLGVRRGQRVYFHCRASGHPSPDMYWTRDGQDGRLGTTPTHQVYLNNTLVIFSAAATDTGVYWCHADNIRGNETAVATLTVSVPPEFSIAPANQTVRIGSHVQLDCVADGVPVPSQSWSYNNGSLGLDDNMQLFPNSTLLIAGLRPSQVGRYTCTAVNVAGSSSVTATIETKDIPEFIVIPSNKTVNQSDSVTFQCQGVAMETPSVIWYRILVGGDLLPLATQNENGRIYISSEGDLKITEVTSADQGWYRCRLLNSVANISSDAFLKVQVPPSILNTNSPQTTERLASVTLTCQSFGNPSPSLLWISPIGQTVSNNSSAYLLIGHALQILSPNEERDGGNWTCQSCNILGCVQDVVQLFVQGKPVITNFNGQGNDSALYLTCSVTSLPKASVEFFSAIQRLTSDTQGHTINGVTMVIDFEYVKTQYSCVATNRYGSTISTITVPGTSSLPSALNTTSREVTLQITQPSDQSNLPLLGFSVQYKVNGTSSWQTARHVQQGTMVTVQNLIPHTRYIFRVAGVNLLGMGSYSQQTTIIQTLPDAPSSPRLLFVSRRDNNTIVLSWKPPLHLNDEAGNLAYIYEVWELGEGQDKAPTLYVSQTVPYNQSTGVQIAGLVLGTQYNITVQTINVVLAKHSEPVWIRVDLGLSGEGSSAVGGLRPDIIIAIVFGILGSGAIILVIAFVFVHVRHHKKSDAMSLINKKLSLDQFYMENPKSLYDVRKSAFSLKGRVSGVSQGFYKLDYDMGSLPGGDNSSTSRSIVDKDVLLMASNPLYEEVITDARQGNGSDVTSRVTPPPQAPPTITPPPTDAADGVTHSWEQIEIEFPRATDNFLLKPTPTTLEVPESPAGSDVAEKHGQVANHQPADRDAESELTELERSLDEIYSLGLSDASSPDHLYASPRKTVSKSSTVNSHSPRTRECTVVAQDTSVTSVQRSSQTFAARPVIQTIMDTALSNSPPHQTQREMGESNQGREPILWEDNIEGAEKDMRVQYDTGQEDAEENLRSAALY